MNLFLWILACGLALAFTVGGVSQLVMPRERYRAVGPSQHWVDDFDDVHLKIIGSIKILGCLGLILPAATGVVPTLTPLAACGLMLVMSGAVTTRFRRREWRFLVGDLLYVSLFALLAWGRFDLQPF
jgi:uncharacterized membrane protein